jgi:glycosyltransferase involved in cell wall biosynthesis
LHRAEKIITVSETTRTDLLELFSSVDPKKVQAIYPGVAVPPQYEDSRMLEIKEKFNLKKPFLLFVGTLEPRKNLINVIRSFVAAGVDAELILAGSRGWKSDDIFCEIDKGAPAVRYLGLITDEERNILMKLARGFIFPSYYEGFGLPVVEALLSGTRTIVSTAPVFRELFSFEVEFVAPESLRDLISAIKKVLSSERLDLAQASAVAEWFDPVAAAKKFLEIIRS